MFRKIIVAVDGEEGGHDASALSCALAGPGAEIIVCRVVVHDGATGVADAGEDGPVASAQRSIAAADGPRTFGVLVHERSVAAGLHRLAQEQSADLLIVGSHHEGRTGYLWSADRARATLRDAPCTVAVAPRGYAGAADHSLRSVGVGYDESDEAQLALDMGRALGRALAADVQALEVVEATNWRTPESGAGWKAVDAGQRLSSLAGVTGVVVEGDVHEHLCGFAHEVDVLVLGSHHHGVLSRLVLGDTAAGLTRHVPCVLLVMAHDLSPATTGA